MVNYNNQNLDPHEKDYLEEQERLDAENQEILAQNKADQAKRDFAELAADALIEDERALHEIADQNEK